MFYGNKIRFSPPALEDKLDLANTSTFYRPRSEFVETSDLPVWKLKICVFQKSLWSLLTWRQHEANILLEDSGKLEVEEYGKHLNFHDVGNCFLATLWYDLLI